MIPGLWRQRQEDQTQSRFELLTLTLSETNTPTINISGVRDRELVPRWLWLDLGLRFNSGYRLICRKSPFLVSLCAQRPLHMAPSEGSWLSPVQAPRRGRQTETQSLMNAG